MYSEKRGFYIWKERKKGILNNGENRVKIVFLYFYGLHQLYHSALIAMELSLLDTKLEILCLSSNLEHTNALKAIKLLIPGSKAKIMQLRQPFRYKYLNF